MKLSQFFSREQLLMSVRDILSRFLQAAFISLALTIYISYKIIEDAPGQSIEEDTIARTVTSLVLTFFLSLGVALFFESNSHKRILDRRFPLLPIVYGVIFYFTVKFGQNYSLQGFTYFILHLVGFISFAFFLPYLTKIFSLGEKERNIQNREYSNYYSRVAWTFLMSSIVGVSLVLLGSIAIGSVVSLFELSSIIDEEKYYGIWITFSLAFIAPMYGLREFPRLESIEKNQYEMNRFFSFLIRYVATPAVYIYFIILYAYSIKVLLNFSDWPRGIVSWLVIGFSSFGYGTYIFSKAYEDMSPLIHFFRKWFPFVVIPQLAMLFYAIGLRIYQYDLTMNRYFVVTFGVWLFVTSLYFTLRRSALLAFIPASLALISFVISLGPWSVFSYPFYRQEMRLIGNLQEAKILQNGKIVPLSSERDISKELSTDIASGIDYLCQFDNCMRVREIFPDQIKKIEEKSKSDWERWNRNNTGATYPGPYYWEIQSGIITEIKVNQYAYDDEKKYFPEQEYLSYNVDSQTHQFPITVTGYNRVVQVMNMVDAKWQTSEIVYPYVSVNIDTREVSYFTASGIARTFALKIPEKLLDSSTLPNVSQDDITFDVGDDTVEIKLLLQSFSVKNPRYIESSSTDKENTTYAGGIYGLALVKNKK
ncbi:MAG: hypothetical protein HHAS10_06030 [Candidatus Altimarinota bacterium]